MDISAQTFHPLGRFGTCTFRHRRHFDTWTFRHSGHFGTWTFRHGRFGSWTFRHGRHFGTWAFRHRGHFGTWAYWHGGHFGTGIFWHGGHLGTGIFWHWKFRHGFFWANFRSRIFWRGHFGMVDISAQGFFGTGHFGTVFFGTFQVWNFLAWTFRHVDISARWTFWHRDFSALDISARVFSAHFRLGIFLTFKNFGTLDMMKGFTAKPPLLGRNSPLSLSYNPQPGKSDAGVVFFISPASHHLTSTSHNQPFL